MSGADSPTRAYCSCGTVVVVTECYPGRWQALCRNCYDGTDDAGERAHVRGFGKSPGDALWEWQDNHDEAWAVEWLPRALTDRARKMFEDLEIQINAEAARQRATRKSNDNADGASRQPKQQQG